MLFGKKLSLKLVLLLLPAAVNAQLLTDELGNCINANSPELPSFASFAFPGCMVKIDALPNCYFPTADSVGGMTVYTYQSDDPCKMTVTVLHEAALSNTTINDYVSKSVNGYAKSGIPTGRISSKVDGNVAVIDVPEMIIANMKAHCYQRILKTPEGFAVVSCSVEGRNWGAVADAVKSCIGSARLLSSYELNALTKYGAIVGVDVEGDVFREENYAIDPATGKRRRTNGREYLLKPAKSFLTMKSDDRSSKREVPSSISDGIIYDIFGYSVGIKLLNTKGARKQSDRSLRQNKTLKLAKPFDVCKNVQLYYTPNENLLYKIMLTSETFVNPKIDLMKERLKEMSDAAEKRFHNELKMVESNNGYEATFKKEGSYQSLKIEIVNGTKGERKGKKFQITFIDDMVYRREEGYVRQFKPKY